MTEDDDGRFQDTLLDKDDGKVREYAKECFERSLQLVRSSSPVDGNGLAYVHDIMRIAREVSESVFGFGWREHLLGVYDRLSAEQRRCEKRTLMGERRP